MLAYPNISTPYTIREMILASHALLGLVRASDLTRRIARSCFHSMLWHSPLAGKGRYAVLIKRSLTHYYDHNPVDSVGW